MCERYGGEDYGTTLGFMVRALLKQIWHLDMDKTKEGEQGNATCLAVICVLGRRSYLVCLLGQHTFPCSQPRYPDKSLFCQHWCSSLDLLT